MREVAVCGIAMVMEFIKSWKFMAILFVAMTLSAVAGVIFGVVTHTEPGLYVDVPEWIHYEPDDFPLRVEAYEYRSDGPIRTRDGSIGEAMSRFNARAGFEVFAWAEDSADGDVEIQLNAPLSTMTSEFEHSDPGGSSGIMLVPETRLGFTCFVRTANIAGTEDLPTLVVYHELGHCLLLDHDCYEQSIMCGGDCCTLSPTPDRTIPPWLSDSDSRLLRDSYGR